MMDWCEEIGPEAASARGRSRDIQRIATGEGWSADIGADGETFWVYTDSGTTLDFLHPDEVSELDWRQSSRLRRFASAEARNAWIREQPWWGPQGDANGRIAGEAHEPL